MATHVHLPHTRRYARTLIRRCAPPSSPPVVQVEEQDQPARAAGRHRNDEAASTSALARSRSRAPRRRRQRARHRRMEHGADGLKTPRLPARHRSAAGMPSRRRKRGAERRRRPRRLRQRGSRLANSRSIAACSAVGISVQAGHAPGGERTRWRQQRRRGDWPPCRRHVGGRWAAGRCHVDAGKQLVAATADGRP